jgi:hypothetical protein
MISARSLLGALLVAAPACGGETHASCPVPASTAPTDFECSTCSAETIYTSPSNVWSLVADDADLYFTEGGANGGAARVARIPAGGGDPISVADPAGTPNDLALDGDHLYWTNTGQGDAGAVMALPRAGGASVVLASGGHPRALALDDCTLYWSGDYGIAAMPRAGGGSTILTKIDDAIVCLAVTPTELLAMGESGLRHVSLAGGGVTNFEPSTQGQSIVVRGERVYLLLDYIDPFGLGYVQCRTFDGQMCDASAQTDGYATSLAADDSHVWWLDWGLGGGAIGTVARVPVAGGTTEVVVDPHVDAGGTFQRPTSGPHSIAVTSSAVYWIEGSAVRRLRR